MQCITRERFLKKYQHSKKKKIKMMYESNLCFADVNVLVLTVGEKKKRIDKEGKAGQLIGQKQ